MDRIKLSDNLEMSRLVHGHWRLAEWNFSTQELHSFTSELVDKGITTIDHADIYGDYSCEALFGKVLSSDKSLRNKLQLVTKCGIKLLSDKFPERKVKVYDYSYEHILYSVNQSLKNLNTDYIDLLLLHRPSPFFDPSEVCKAFEKLKKEGKVLAFGVSNFSPAQFDMLNSNLPFHLVTNQVEISPYCLEHFENDNMEFFMKHTIHPMAWSPVAGGKLFNPKDERGARTLKALKEVAAEMDIDSIDTLIYAWILKHPSKPIPIIGSGKMERIQKAIDALNMDISLEHWFKIFIASRGAEMP